MFRSRRHAAHCLLWVCAFGAWLWYGIVRFGLLLLGY